MSFLETSFLVSNLNGLDVETPQNMTDYLNDSGRIIEKPGEWEFGRRIESKGEKLERKKARLKKTRQLKNIRIAEFKAQEKEALRMSANRDRIGGKVNGTNGTKWGLGK